jgi:chromosome segregation ATPase
MSEDDRERMERVERQIAFIVDQQAQYEVRTAKADERWAKADKRWADVDKRWAEADKRWVSTEQSIRALLAIAEIHEREFEGLSEATKELREATKDLREAGKATDERLNVLINVVERHISEGHNGKRAES